MDEKKDNNFSVDTDELKNETKETMNQVKDTIKNVNIKEDSVATKNFVTEMFKSPCEKIKEILEDTAGNFLKFAIIIIVVYLLSEALDTFITVANLGKWAKFGYKFKLVITSVLLPLLRILIPAVTILIMNKNNKKPLTTTICAVTASRIPVIISSLVYLLDKTKVKYISYITSPIGTLCAALSYVLLFFVVKYSFDEKNDSQALKKFAVIQLITAGIVSAVNLIFNSIF